ncbi:MAG TPA: HAD-IIIC family phosphatase [Bryobacteraceae bacterium]|nr:HAD-IIIC family phosphatase [Bryobacteraceae bacterium]
MTVTEALKVIRAAPGSATEYHVLLACGFTPLHLQTFLTAHLQEHLPTRKVQTSVGLFGNLAGTLESAAKSDPHAIAIALEWADLDPRLGYRSAGAVTPSVVPDLVDQARAMLDRIAAAVEGLPAGIRVAISLPSLPLPPFFHAAGTQESQAELLLERDLMEFASRCAARAAVVNRRRLGDESPCAARHDLKSELLAGLPYTTVFADALANALARLLTPAIPKKGLVTDLDNTLWRGIVGEVGPAEVSWDLAGHSQIHCLYQKLLASLAEEGVLIGVASKNDPEVVSRTFERPDLLLSADRIFPIEAHWGAKSGSIRRILDTWNIAADSVVFVDDSPMELAEAVEANPGLEGALFPADDYEAGFRMLRRLRDLFGKERLSKDDAIRLESIRRTSVVRENLKGGQLSEAFLAGADALITANFTDADNPRALELVNKTNQFNLNGRRFLEADWRRTVARPESILMTVAYRDKFGPLGTIAVIEGTRGEDALDVSVWVMSCRAFSRRIEHQCLRLLFDTFSPSVIRFDFAPTPRNHPAREFFASLTGAAPEGPFALERARFEEVCPPLYHKVEILKESEVYG